VSCFFIKFGSKWINDDCGVAILRGEHLDAPWYQCHATLVNHNRVNDSIGMKEYTLER